MRHCGLGYKKMDCKVITKFISILFYLSKNLNKSSFARSSDATYLTIDSMAANATDSAPASGGETNP
jgi:hypothetical protein